MAETGYCWMSARNMSPISSRRSPYSVHYMLRPTSKIRASIRRNDFSLITTKKTSTSHNKAASRPLITISNGRWDDKWSRHYTFSLQQLHLDDLVEDGHEDDAQVSINLCIHKHASFGLSVEGRIVTSFTRKCRNCSSPYCREIDANFNVWVLPSSRRSSSTQLPEIGGDDPSDTCSESCEKSEPKLEYIGQQKAASIDRRWSRLLELRNSCQ
ncbi:large ribosomal RNA subunit accumulation protein YCED homolog 2, chloroplastic isoform X2 [Cornus florida]|uniref:large ribosomal RNA subunit accumulation protein YCED homolog 2, chloroplastic isoform X2 n=1 Tax=Cornus florida TaxID=4283 RepID=UPI00289AE35B|nr:large ribosomal RNA subunit accumulation protein YCED homolog 2, chloroplastic isoform X2 [Cornus florida]